MIDLAARIAIPAVIAVVSAGTLLNEINWSTTITLGSLIVGILVGVAGLSTFAYGVKWKTAYEAEKARGDSLSDGREAYKLRGDRLEGELADCKARENALVDEMVAAKTELARYAERPNLDQVLQIIGEQSVRQDAASDVRAEKAIEQMAVMFGEKLDKHDERVHEQQRSILNVLGMIARKLGPEGEL